MEHIYKASKAGPGSAVLLQEYTRCPSWHHVARRTASIANAGVCSITAADRVETTFV